MITKRYLTGGINGTTHAYNDPTALVGHTTAFDRAGNKLYERHLEAESRSHLYQPFNSDGSFGVGYDSANRLLQYQRGVLSSTIIPYRVNPGASIATPTTLPGADQIRTYGLDGLGNWKTSNFTVVNDDSTTTSTAEVRAHNYVNEITSVKDTTPTPFVYDANGNLVNDGVRIYQYDALNRLIQVSSAATSAVLATYAYDALGRRIQKTINDLGEGFGGLTGDIPAGTTDYLYDGQQIIEERNDSAPTIWTKVYFWGQYIDELMFFAVPGESAPTTYRVLSDLLYRSVASVTTSNVITEAYDTDAYGNTLCYSGPGTDDEWFTDDDVTTNNPINTTIFTGRQYDPESQIYYYRARYYSPAIGRFISRDPIGIRGGINLYAYVRSNAVNKVDPSGWISYDVDDTNCLLKVGMKWTLQFQNKQLPNGTISWTPGMEDEWKSKAQSAVDTYFSNLKYTCVSSCCKCKDGIAVKFDLQFVDSGADYTVTVVYGKAPPGTVGVTTGSPTATFDGVTPDPGSHMPGQNTIIHETGHMLGLQHPGQSQNPPAPRNSDEDYSADEKSLMGWGMTLRMPDFQKAFCDKIHTTDSSGKPCSWTAQGG